MGKLGSAYAEHSIIGNVSVSNLEVFETGKW